MSAPAERDEKELAVLNAAVPVFLAHGFSAATTDMIQREAGVSKATMYARFPDKEALFAAAIEARCASMTAAIQAIRVSPGDIAGTLAVIASSYLDIILAPSSLALFRVIVAEAPRFPKLARRFFLAGPEVFVATVRGRLDEAARAGEIDIGPVGLEAAADLFIGMVRSQALLECMTHPDTNPSAVQRDRWTRLAVDTFLRAFGAPGARGA